MLHVVCMYVYVNVMANISLMQFFYLHFLDIYTIWKCAGIFFISSESCQQFPCAFFPIFTEILSTCVNIYINFNYTVRELSSFFSPPYDAVDRIAACEFLSTKSLFTKSIFIHGKHIYIGRDIYRINHRFSEREWVSE